MASKVKKALRAIGLDRWEVRQTIWPYPDGWGTYNPFTRTVLDTGLSTKEEAQRRCDEMNNAPL
jgi:hypothetical protein